MHRKKLTDFIKPSKSLVLTAPPLYSDAKTGQVEPSPLPWTHIQPSYYAGDARQIQWEGKIVIASYVKPQDAVLIIRAVNNHEKLIALCKEMIDRWGEGGSYPEYEKIIHDAEAL